MALNGLLLLTTSTVSVASRSRVNLLGAKKFLDVFDKRGWAASVPPPPVLYVLQWCPSDVQETKGPSASGLTSLIYSQGNAQCPTLDIRVILNGGLSKGLLGRPNIPIDLVMVEGNQNRASLQAVRDFVNQWFKVSKQDYPVEYLSKPEDEVLAEEGNKELKASQDQGYKQYEVVALGGTFDRMHNAHKILLTEAVLRCTKEIIVGVTSDDMIKGKLLYEFIEKCPVRLDRVKTFLADVAPHLKHRVVQINDPFGPTITEKDVGLIVVSTETIRGAEKINEIRKDKGFSPLDVHDIELFTDELRENEFEEDKISSSSARIRILGDRLRCPLKPPSLPYIIGLTGGICSGKSTLCSYLETIGLGIINCDALGHDAYIKGTKCFDQIVECFGEDVLTPDKNEINRKILGAKVFGNPTELNKLTSLVWPEIRRLAIEQIEKYSEEGRRAIILDAAVLLEAGWDDMCHDVWVVIIPKEETIRRIQKRDGLSPEDAEKRVAAQVSNHERVARANFVFCSLWEVDFTRRQADHAWTAIKSVIDTL